MNVYIILIMTLPLAEMCFVQKPKSMCEIDPELCEGPKTKLKQETSCEKFKDGYLDDIVKSNGVLNYKGTETIDLKDILQTNCATCDEKLKVFFKQGMKCYLKQQPEKVKKIKDIYDPEGSYVVDP